jgi:hypothetical protein
MLLPGSWNESVSVLACRYFTNLANVAASVNEAPAPSQEQLRVFYQRSGGGAVVTPEQIHALAAQVGIAKAVVAKVLQVGRFESAVDADRFLFLLLVMSCESFAAVLQGIFNVFGDKIPSEKFRLLISYLAPDMVRACILGSSSLLCPDKLHPAYADTSFVLHICALQDPDVTTLFLNELSSQLIDITNLTYDVAVTLPVFQPKL